ncbi:MAG: hypothetical protein C5B51_29470 [Terriglobia bacterium]|nr:MAG: hypothetical protein C5B51_29470 [Terriglobia bacterium]
MRYTLRNLLLSIPLLAAPLAAQWLNYPTPGVPRTKDGKPNLSAPAPRTAGGKPDFSGIWMISTGKYLENLAADVVEVPMTPAAAKIYQERQANFGKDRPSGHCLPHSVTDFDAHPMPKKLIQTPGVLVILFESYHTYRQIFIDGRPLPDRREPAWFGYSAGKWDGDTLVVDTVGLNEKTWLDDAGHPHSPDLHVIEHFRRPDFGHMEVQVTINDPKAYTKPWAARIPWQYMPDTELMDWVCENDLDGQHLVGK